MHELGHLPSTTTATSDEARLTPHDACARSRLTNVTPLARVALLAYALGAAFRLAYVLHFHHPRHWVRSDAAALLNVAERLLVGPQGIRDTVWPPGAPALLALAARLDPSLELAAWYHVLLSALVPLLIAHGALLAAGHRAAALALIFASLHFGFVHYGGIFLAEQTFQFAVVLALWLTVLGVLGAERAGVSTRGWRPLLVHGASAGAAWAWATSLRPNALPIAALSALGLLAFSSRRSGGVRRAAPLVLGGTAALVLALLPLADRCTRLSGFFCPVSNNVVMNMVLGQAGDVSSVYFQDARSPSAGALWAPPALSANAGVSVVPFSMFDARAGLAWLWQRWQEQPSLFIERAGLNVARLFRSELWPPGFGPLPRGAVVLLDRAFAAAVLLPGAIAGILSVRGAWRGGSSLGAVLASIPLALAAASALSLGEPRYRVPFDSAFIVLAAALYAGEALGAEPRTEARAGTSRLAVIGGGVAALALVGVVLVSHPLLAVGAHLVGEAPRVGAARRERLALAELGPSKHAGEPSDTGGHVFACRPSCPELALDLGSEWRSRELELALDARDTYQVTFYRRGAAVAFAVIRSESRVGYRLHSLDVPESARHGFDVIGVQPLHGDGHYAIGHVRESAHH